MTKQELINKLNQTAEGESKASIERTLNNLARIVAIQLMDTGEMVLPGIGKLKVGESKAREGRNPATGETLHIPAKKRIKFSAIKALKDAVGD